MHASRLNEKRMALEAKTFFLKNRSAAMVEMIESGIPPSMLWSVTDAVELSPYTSERTRELMASIKPGFAAALADTFGMLPHDKRRVALRATGWLVIDAFEVPDQGRTPIALITAAVTVTNKLIDSGYLVLPTGDAFEKSAIALIDDFNAAAADPATSDVFERAVPSGKRLAAKMMNSFNRLGFYRGIDATAQAS